MSAGCLESPARRPGWRVSLNRTHRRLKRSTEANRSLKAEFNGIARQDLTARWSDLAILRFRWIRRTADAPIRPRGWITSSRRTRACHSSGSPAESNNIQWSLKGQAASGVGDHRYQSIRGLVLPCELGRADSQVQSTIAHWARPLDSAIVRGRGRMAKAAIPSR